MPTRDRVMILAQSGRALAACAVRGGFVPLVADLFADQDTRALAEDCVAMPGTPAFGLRRRDLRAAVDRLAQDRDPIGVVVGSGFEARPDLLDALGGHRLLGNPAPVVARAKDPAAFARLCATLAVPHPEMRFDAAPDDGWLEKAIGGAGGFHVRPARAGRPPRRGHYLQRRVEGTPVACLFLAAGHAIRVVGFSAQWSDPAPGRPFRYGGAVRPAPPEQQAAMVDCIARLAAELHLVGLNSADFLVRAADFDLLEINPRPGATLDLFPHPDLFALHVRACQGHLPDDLPPAPGAAAAAIVYAPHTLTVPDGFAWPEWCADRQHPGSRVAAGAPLCTVLAFTDGPGAARSLVDQRAQSILAGMSP